MAQADIFVATAKEHTYGLRYGEMMASNVFPLVCEDLRLNFLPDDFPTVKSSAEIAAKVSAVALYLAQNPNAGVELGERIRKEHDYLTCFDQFYQVCDKVVAKQKADTKFGDWTGIAQKALDGVHTIGHREAVVRMQNHTESGSDLTKNMLIPPGFLRWAIMEAGFRDTQTGWEPTYERI